MHRIEFEQMRIGLDRPQIIDCDHFDIVMTSARSKKIPSYSAESIDCNFHGILLILRTIFYYLSHYHL